MHFRRKGIPLLLGLAAILVPVRVADSNPPTNSVPNDPQIATAFAHARFSCTAFHAALADTTYPDGQWDSRGNCDGAPVGCNPDFR